MSQGPRARQYIMHLGHRLRTLKNQTVQNLKAVNLFRVLWWLVVNVAFIYLYRVGWRRVPAHLQERPVLFLRLYPLIYQSILDRSVGRLTHGEKKNTFTLTPKGNLHRRHAHMWTMKGSHVKRERAHSIQKETGPGFKPWTFMPRGEQGSATYTTLYSLTIWELCIFCM